MRNLRVKITREQAECLAPEHTRDGYFYRDDQYLASFIRRSNMIIFESSGHGKYGEAKFEIETAEEFGKPTWEKL